MDAGKHLTEPTSKLPEWIWFPGSGSFGVLRKRLHLASGGRELMIQCAAFDRYELYLNGRLVLEGPLPGDQPRWIPIDSVSVPLDGDRQSLLVEVMVYHSGLERVHYRGNSRPGFWAILSVDNCRYATDRTWQAAGLSEWRQDTPRMNHLLDPLEDVDLTHSQWRWSECGSLLDIDDEFRWDVARPVDLPAPFNTEAGWLRKAAFPVRSLCEAQRYWMGLRDGCEEPELDASVRANGGVALNGCLIPGPVDGQLMNLLRENACVVDFGEAVTGMPCLQIDTPVALTIAMGWGERLSADGLPVIYGKGTLYASRYRIPPGRHLLKLFHWTGFRYLRILLWSRFECSAQVWLSVSAVRRALQLPAVAPIHALSKIESLCRYTLEKTLPEYPADCPTREKAHYWTDGLFISLALERMYGEGAFTDWYCEAFRRVPMNAGGLFTSVYPGSHRVLVDACLAPVIGWRYIREQRPDFVVDSRLWDKAMQVNAWYEQYMDDRGLLHVPGWEPDSEALVFLDHPGLPWHHFKHPSLDRRNPSAALNLYYLAFLQSLQLASSMCEGAWEEAFANRASALTQAIRETFWDGVVLRDSDVRCFPDAGVSWLANALGVVCGILRDDEAVKAIRTVMENYDEVCRCTPGTIFWFLQAVSLTKLCAEAEPVLCRLFENMLARGATATWETFDGDLEDSLCHPWLAAPVAMYLMDPEGFGCRPPVTQCVASWGEGRS